MNENMTSGPDAPLDPTWPAFDCHDSLDGLGWTHFIGIGGSGMSILAEILFENGVHVTGSDREPNDKTERLESLGIPIRFHQRQGNIGSARTVVYSSAVRADNPEIVAARMKGAHIVHRSDILALLMNGRRTVSVAGTHGKTTTSSLIAHILVHGHNRSLSDPSYAVGGSMQGPGGERLDGGHAGRKPVMVAEADESDGSFLKYHPSIAVVTNVQADHMDHYGTVLHYQQAFAQHLGHAREWVILGVDDHGSRAVLQSLDKRVLSHTIVYGTDQDEPGIAQSPAAFVVRIESEGERQGSDLERFVMNIPVGLLPAIKALDETKRKDSEDAGSPQSYNRRSARITVNLRIPGIHNARNATAAILAAILLGMSPEDAAQSAESFMGASRRFEIKGTCGGVTVVDDYAHHPVEIAALVDAERRRFPGSVLRILFQPHLFSRTAFFAGDFARALMKADDIVVTGIFSAREKHSDFPGISAQTIVDEALALDPNQSGGRICAIEDMKAAARTMAMSAHSGDVIFTVGAGDITDMGAVILQTLRVRHDEGER